MVELDWLLSDPEFYDSNYKEWLPEAEDLMTKWLVQNTPSVQQAFELDAFFLKWRFGGKHSQVPGRAN
jgi:hypothetical protein